LVPPRVFQSGEERKGKGRKGKVCVDIRICGVEPLRYCRNEKKVEEDVKHF
jgi:hypothetical protein